MIVINVKNNPSYIKNIFKFCDCSRHFKKTVIFSSNICCVQLKRLSYVIITFSYRPMAERVMLLDYIFEFDFSRGIICFKVLRIQKIAVLVVGLYFCECLRKRESVCYQ